MSENEIKLGEDAQDLLDAKWDAFDKAQDQTFFARAEFEALALDAIKAAKVSPRFWGAFKKDDGWYLMKAESPPRQEG